MSSAAQLGKPLPRDSAPNNYFYTRQFKYSNTRRAVGMHSTTFVRQVLHQPEGATIARCVARCRPAEYRVWVKATADRYPVNFLPPSMSACPVTSLSILSRAG
jgi:hypothetical protein